MGSSTTLPLLLLVSRADAFICTPDGDNIIFMASGDGRRPGRVAEMVLRELSLLLLRDLRDPRLRGVTLTSVRMSDDLRQGRVFFSHFEGSAHAADAIKGFQSAEGFIRRNIGRALGLRYTPQFDFEFDPGLENAARIEALLRESRARQ